MLKKELIERLARRLNTSKSNTEKTINALFEEITNLLAQEDSILFSGFGRFSVIHKSARLGRNPLTGETIQIAAKAAPTFRPTTELKKFVAKKVKPKHKA